MNTTRLITSAGLAIALASSMTIPAFAYDGELTGEASGNAQIEQTSAAHSLDSSAASTPGLSTSSVPNASEIVNVTVPLAQPGTEIPSESIASLEVPTTTAPVDAGGEAIETVEDTETCLWSYDGSTWSTMRGGSPMTITNALAMGIDVSEWQGNIDWARAKAAGVQYAILRVAYGSSTSGHEDRWFAEYVQGCKDNDIPIGVYLYSIANSADTAYEEANFALDIMSRAGVTPSDLIFPVYYDIEDKVHLDMTVEGRGDMAEAFCNRIEEAGYVPGIYASQSWLDHQLIDPRFDRWTKWAASYPSAGELNATSSYTSAHDMWQCMSRGIIDGISTRVDINFDYRFSLGNYSAVYDYDFYIANNPDVYEVFGGDRLATFMHFLNDGMDDGRISSPTFNLHGYFNSNVDLRREFGLDLKQYYIHYQNVGQYEGRSCEDSLVPLDLVKGISIMDYSDIYDPYVYLMNNPDAKEVYTKVGFDGNEYIDDPGLFKHFVSTGITEGRVAK